MSLKPVVRRNLITMLVQLWLMKDFYDPDFVSDVISMGTATDTQVKYNFPETPAIVNVVGSFNQAGETWYFVGTGSQLTRGDHEYDNTGGLLYAYSSSATRVWSTANYVFSSHDGWGYNANNPQTKIADVRVYVWRPWKCLTPLFDSEWFDVDQTEQTFYELSYGQCDADRHVDVELLAVDGANQGFIFKGTGLAQTLGKRRPDDAAGGVVFAHSATTVRLWMTYSSSDPDRGLVTVQGWGQAHQQLSSTGKVRVRVWCNNHAGMPRWAQSGTYLIPTGGAALDSPLVNIGSATTSFIRCAGLCIRTACCLYLSMLDDVCTIYAELQFGKTPAQPDSRDLYYLRPNLCETV